MPIVTNGSFEDGDTGWTWTSSPQNVDPIQLDSGNAHTGDWIGGLRGWGSAGTDTISQQITIPAGSVATLTFWLSIFTSGSGANDSMVVAVYDSAGTTLLETLHTYPSTDGNAPRTTYSQKTFDLTAYLSSTVTLKWSATENSSTRTTEYFVDDVDVSATGGDVTLALTGCSATGSAGSLAVVVGDNSVALSGVSSTATPGEVFPPFTQALTGVSATETAGSVGAALQETPTGVSATGAVSAPTVGVPVAIGGVSASGSVGSVSYIVSPKLKGVSATTALAPFLQSLIPPSVGAGGVPSRVRWVGARVLVDGTDMRFGLSGSLTLDSSIEFGQQNTLTFHLSDSPWPAAGNLWGNKPAEAYISLGDNPRLMEESKVFTGYTLQKRDNSANPIEADLVCADASVAYTGIAVCYSLGAYSGKTRGQIITEVAATVGVTLTDVPVGGVVNKPVTLNNANLLQFITEFGLVENWYPHIDRYGDLSVRVLNQPATGWVMDVQNGDVDLGTFQETYPTRPPCRWYVTGSQAVLAVLEGETEPDRVTTVQVDEEQALYNPKCRRSVDPSGHSLPAAVLMVVARVTTEITTIGGDEVRRVTTTESFYNPAAKDPNYDTYPKGANYADAYVDNSFHRDPVETLMETSKITVDTIRDDLGSVLSQHTGTMGWYSPQSQLNMFLTQAVPEKIKNGPGSFIYSDGKAHVSTEETYRLVSVVDTSYEYDSTQGTLLNQVSEVQTWFAPESPCDTLVTYSGSPTFRGPLTSVQVSNAGVIWDTFGDHAPAPYAGWQNLFMSTNFFYLRRRNFKWGERDWRTQTEETLQLTKRVSTRFNVVDGQTVSTKEATEQFMKFQSAANAHPEIDAPPWMFADGQWYEGPEAFALSGVKFTHYEKFGSTGHAKTTYSVNLATGEVTVDAPTYSDGAVPLAPTIGSALRWARLPIVSEITVAGCEFVDSKANLDLPYAENMDDLNRAGTRAAQRAMAIIREFDCAWNPLVEPGDGLMLTSREHGIVSEWHIITDLKATVTSGADMHVIAERWPEIA